MLRDLAQVVAFVAFFALHSGVGWTQPSGANSVPSTTLAEALGYARAHQPQIRSSLAELAARRAESHVPRAQWLPQVGGTLQIFGATATNTTTVYLTVPEVDIPRIGATRAGTSTSWTPSASTFAGLSVTQEVYDFGRIAAQIAATDALTDVARAGADDVSLAVQLAVEEAYHGVLAAKEVVGATEEAYARALTHRDYARAGTTSGLRPPIDLTRAQADVALLEVRRIRAQAGLHVARAGLAAAIGSESIEIDAQPISVDQSPAPAFEEALRTAVQRNPQLRVASARLRAQQATTRAIFRELAPNLTASAGLNGRAGGAPASSNPQTPYGDGWLPAVGNWHLGLIFEWNIFDGTVLARRDASRAREDALRADHELVRITVGASTERAYLDLETALRALPGLEQVVAAARANDAQADARFKAGLGTIIELADAEALLTNALLELALGRFGVARARAALGRLMAQSRWAPITTSAHGGGRR